MECNTSNCIFINSRLAGMLWATSLKLFYVAQKKKISKTETQAKPIGKILWVTAHLTELTRRSKKQPDFFWVNTNYVTRYKLILVAAFGTRYNLQQQHYCISINNGKIISRMQSINVHVTRTNRYFREENHTWSHWRDSLMIWTNILREYRYFQSRIDTK